MGCVFGMSKREILEARKYKTCLSRRRMKLLIKEYKKLRDSKREQHVKGKGFLTRMDLSKFLHRDDDPFSETFWLRVMFMMGRPPVETSDLEDIGDGVSRAIARPKNVTGADLRAGDRLKPSEWLRMVEKVCMLDDEDLLTEAFRAMVNGVHEDIPLMNVKHWVKRYPAFGDSAQDQTSLDRPFWVQFHRLEQKGDKASAATKWSIFVEEWLLMCRRSERVYYPLRWWRSWLRKRFFGGQFWDELYVKVYKPKAAKLKEQPDSRVKDHGIQYVTSKKERNEQDMPAEHKEWLRLTREKARAKTALRVTGMEEDGKDPEAVARAEMEKAKAKKPPRVDSYEHFEVDPPPGNPNNDFDLSSYLSEEGPMGFRYYKPPEPAKKKEDEEKVDPFDRMVVKDHPKYKGLAAELKSSGMSKSKRLHKRAQTARSLSKLSFKQVQKHSVDASKKRKEFMLARAGTAEARIRPLTRERSIREDPLAKVKDVPGALMTRDESKHAITVVSPESGAGMEFFDASGRVKGKAPSLRDLKARHIGVEGVYRGGGVLSPGHLGRKRQQAGHLL